jgi:hypothetical protein
MVNQLPGIEHETARYQLLAFMKFLFSMKPNWQVISLEFPDDIDLWWVISSFFLSLASYQFYEKKRKFFTTDLKKGK